MTVLRTVEAHWQALRATRLAALLDAPAAFGVTHAQSSANTEQDWRAHAAGRNGVAFFLAWDGADAVGIAGGVTGADGLYQLIAMWVHPAHRGRGVAGQLVDAVKTCAVAAGQASMVLDVAPGNGAAVRLYQQHGFAFLAQWESLASHPHIQLQRMACRLQPAVAA